MLGISCIIFTIVCFVSCTAASEENDLCAASAYADICVRLGQKSYLIDGNAKLNWYEAERLCRRQNGYLATIQNGGEMSALSDYLVSRGYLDGDQQFWLGSSDLGARGKLYSVQTGNALNFARWASGQPDFGGNENGAALGKQNGEFLMKISNVNNRLRYVCELQERGNRASKKLLITYRYI